MLFAQNIPHLRHYETPEGLPHHHERPPAYHLEPYVPPSNPKPKYGDLPATSEGEEDVPQSGYWSGVGNCQEAIGGA